MDLVAILSLVAFAFIMNTLGKLGKANRAKNPMPRPPRPGMPPGDRMPANIELPQEKPHKPHKPLGFDVPHLEGAPQETSTYPIEREYPSFEQVTSAEIQAQIEAARHEAELEEADRKREAEYRLAREQQDAAIRAADEAAYRKAARIPGDESKQGRPVLTSRQARQAIVLAEIIGPPKARRRRFRH